MDDEKIRMILDPEQRKICHAAWKAELRSEQKTARAIELAEQLADAMNVRFAKPERCTCGIAKLSAVSTLCQTCGGFV